MTSERAAVEQYSSTPVYFQSSSSAALVHLAEHGDSGPAGRAILVPLKRA